MIQSPKIPVNKSKLAFFTKDQKWWFCGALLRKTFDIPESAVAVQFRAFKEPAPGRWKIRIPADLDYWEVYFENDRDDISYQIVETGTELDILKLLGRRRKVWYIEVYYWS
jgi:hypothetical protein